jgi:hypothetical protein
VRRLFAALNYQKPFSELKGGEKKEGYEQSNPYDLPREWCKLRTFYEHCFHKIHTRKCLLLPKKRVHKADLRETLREMAVRVSQGYDKLPLSWTL